MFGRMYSEKWARVSALLVFVGFNTTFLPQFIMGSRGMPRRYYNYLDQFQPLHAMSTYGSWILGAGLFLTLIYLIASLFGKEHAPANPWLGTTLEWKTQSPPIKHNFHETPVLDRTPTTIRPCSITSRRRNSSSRPQRSACGCF
jgi:cytochrome c oxidase subunit 1